MARKRKSVQRSLGYVHKMYFSRKRLCFYIVVLAQLVNALGEDRNHGYQIFFNGSSTELETTEVYTDAKKNDGEIKTANTTSTNNTVYNCLTDKTYGPVELVNTTRLIELLIQEPGTANRSRNDEDSTQLPGTCVLILFYARWCIFCSQAAPHFNAIPRFFPHIKAVAIDAMKHRSFVAQYGIVAVPTLFLTHNGVPVVEFNETVYNLEVFASFIMRNTNLKPNWLLYLTPTDFRGPVPSTLSNETDYYLVLSWVFIAVCALYFTSQSRWWQQFVELVQNTWRESNAQHEHVD